jgi:hypothetical protein
VTKPEDRVEADAQGVDGADEEDDAGDAGFEGFAAAFDRERLHAGSSADAALAALLEAGPEAFEHLLNAAQELLLAAKSVVDAGERAIESRRAATDAGAHGASELERRVRRIDLA